MLSLENLELRPKETTSFGDFPLFGVEGEVVLSLPTETRSYGAESVRSAPYLWTPDGLPPYSRESYAILEDEPERERDRHAYELFSFYERQLLQRERGTFGVYDTTFDPQSGSTQPTALGSDDEIPEERWRRVGETLETFRSFEDGWDGYGAPAPNQASLAVAQTLLRGLQPNVSVPRLMIDAEGDIVLTWEIDGGSVFLTVERSKLHLLVKAVDATESDEVQYEGILPKSVLGKLPKDAR